MESTKLGAVPDDLPWLRRDYRSSRPRKVRRTTLAATTGSPVAYHKLLRGYERGGLETAAMMRRRCSATVGSVNRSLGRSPVDPPSQAPAYVERQEAGVSHSVLSSCCNDQFVRRLIEVAC